VFTGWFDQLSISAVLRISSIGLAPYCEDASMSLPNKPFEYMAGGLPILSSLRGELETLIRDEKIGLQYQAGDMNSLIRGIQWFVENKQEREKMGMRGQKILKERFSAKVVYPKLVEHIEHIVNVWGTNY